MSKILKALRKITKATQGNNWLQLKNRHRWKFALKSVTKMSWIVAHIFFQNLMNFDSLPSLMNFADDNQSMASNPDFRIRNFHIDYLKSFYERDLTSSKNFSTCLHGSNKKILFNEFFGSCSREWKVLQNRGKDKTSYTFRLLRYYVSTVWRTGRREKITRLTRTETPVQFTLGHDIPRGHIDGHGNLMAPIFGLRCFSDSWLLSAEKFRWRKLFNLRNVLFTMWKSKIKSNVSYFCR